MPDHPLLVAVIEDDPSLCRALGRLLRAADYAVATYASAEAFLADPERGRAGCAVVDIHLGGMSGLDLGGRLRQDPEPLPLVFITAHDLQEDLVGGAGAGSSPCLRKPFAARVLLEAIQAVTRRPSDTTGSADRGLTEPIPS